MMRLILKIVVLAAISTSFGLTLTLEDCIKISATNNPSVLAAEAALEASDAQRYQAFTNFLPKAKIQATYTRLNEAPYTVLNPENFPFPTPPGMEPVRIEMGKAEMDKVEASLTQPLAAPIFTGYALARKGTEQKKLEFKKARIEAVSQAEKAFFQLAKAKAFLEIAKISKKQVDDHIKQLTDMVEAGLVHRKDLLAAKVKGYEAELMLTQAQNAVKLAKDGLKMALGLPDTVDVDIDYKLNVTDYSIPRDSAISMALRNSIDIRLMKVGIEAARLSIQMAFGELLPSFAAVFNYDYQKPNRQLENKWYDSWTAVGVISWNIFDWGANVAKIKQAKANLNQIMHTKKLVIDGVRLKVKAAYNTLEEKKKSLEIANSGLEAAKESYKVVSDLFSEGAATNLEFLDAQADFTRAKLNVLNAMADYNIAKVELEKLTGELENKIDKILAKEQ